MTPTNPTPLRKAFTARRLALLGSVAAVAIALAVAAPGHFITFNLTQPSQAQAAESALPAQDTQGPAGFADLVAKVKPAVISVRVKIEQSMNGKDTSDTSPFPQGSPMQKFFKQFGLPGMPNMPQGKEVITGLGSGFFISPDGYAVTNNHVVDHAKTVQVKTDDGQVYTAKVIGTDPKTDLALIKVKADKSFPYVKFADHSPRIGDWVVAVGNPFGLSETVTAGIVSAKNRDIGGNTLDDYIQIDAPINKGNSGGPAFNVHGNVIGVNTAIYSPSGGSIGIGFDIPASTVKLVVAQLKEHGHVNHAYLGVMVQAVNADIADSLGLKKAQGALVDQVKPASPAAKAGLKSGDVITAVNGNEVKDSRDLARTIGMMAPDSTVKLALLQNGEAKTVSVTLAKLPGENSGKSGTFESSNGSGVPHLGLTLAPASAVAGAGGKGVAVVGVDPNGPAAERGFETGDIILDVGGKPVANVKDVRNEMHEAHASGKHDVLMRVKTSHDTRFIAVPVGKA
jgi:serine protease Do